MEQQQKWAKAGQRRRLGAWLPSKEQAMAEFRREIMDRARVRHTQAEPANVIRDFKSFVMRDSVLRMHLTRAIDEALEQGFELGYSNVEDLMIAMDYITTYSPPFSDTSTIILPLNGLLEWPMCMPSGHALFRDPAFNRHLKRILNFWCGFLSGPHSRTHLNEESPSGWFCPRALEATGMHQFLCDPQAPHWGFSSWNDFFARRLRPGVRPVCEPQDSKVIGNACEAAAYNIEHEVRRQDKFWLKDQPYSLAEIFTGTETQLAERFTGGSVYQAYLGAHNYHRWHAPVSGRIHKAYLVDGTYYSDIEAVGDDPGGLNHSQGYTTAVAARAVIVIEADDSALGLVACIFVGMAEVSSCVIDVVTGQHVDKGDEVGYFQFGGSTYCLVFEPGVIARFEPQPPFDDKDPPIPVNAHIATAK